MLLHLALRTRILQIDMGLPDYGSRMICEVADAKKEHQKATDSEISCALSLYVKWWCDNIHGPSGNIDLSEHLVLCAAYPEEMLQSIEHRPFIAQLELEEAFFLAYAVGWLHIKDSVSRSADFCFAISFSFAFL